MTIIEIVERIRHAVYGREVREHIAKGIEKANDVAIETKDRQQYVEENVLQLLDEITGKDVMSAPEIIAAKRGFDGTTYETLKERLDSEKLQSTTDLEKTKVSLKQVKNTHEIEIIAHRGYSYLAPENTLPAFDLALVNGVQSLEFDVQVTADGELVVIHDTTVDRTTNGTGSVSSLSLDYLKTLDAGSKYSPFYEGARIPTLDEVLTLARNNTKTIYPEIKGYRTVADIQMIVDKIVEYGFESSAVIQSFKHSDLVEVRRLNKQIKLAHLVFTPTEFTQALQFASQDGNTMIFIESNALLANSHLVDQARQAEVEIAVWTVDKSSEVQTLVGLGVKRFITNKLRGKVTSV